MPERVEASEVVALVEVRIRVKVARLYERGDREDGSERPHLEDRMRAKGGRARKPRRAHAHGPGSSDARMGCRTDIGSCSKPCSSRTR